MRKELKREIIDHIVGVLAGFGGIVLACYITSEVFSWLGIQ